MSMHKDPKFNPPEAVAMMKAYGYQTESPSVVSDAFRSGWLLCAENAKKSKNITTLEDMKSKIDDIVERSLEIFQEEYDPQYMTHVLKNGEGIYSCEYDSDDDLVIIVEGLQSLKTTLLNQAVFVRGENRNLEYSIEEMTIKIHQETMNDHQEEWTEFWAESNGEKISMVVFHTGDKPTDNLAFAMAINSVAIGLVAKCLDASERAFSKPLGTQEKERMATLKETHINLLETYKEVFGFSNP